MIDAGDLTERITIQARIVTLDSDAVQQIIYKDIATVWAQIITTGGGEFYAAQRVNAETTAVFKIRYRAGLNTTMRIKWGNRIFEILNIPPLNKTEQLISAKEVVAGG